MTNPTQDQLKTFVQNSIGINQSSLIDELLSESIVSYDDIDNLYYTDQEKHDLNIDDDDNDMKEIYEWWTIDIWMTDKLQEQNEPLLITRYGTWWGRTTTGQAIYMDQVIMDIWKELHN